MTSDKKIFPRNLTSRLAYEAAGNPVSSRLEDVVGNCFPGLEIDLRNLDRRFFPGLIFNFAAREHRELEPEQPHLYGARLFSVEYECDPDLHSNHTGARALLAEFHGLKGRQLKQGEWFIHEIEQEGNEIFLYEVNSKGEEIPLDGMVVWRLIRNLNQGRVKIQLIRRDWDRASEAAPIIELEGWRREYVDPKKGTLNDVFQPGELVQSLCSPWQHDFRDCACMYWASSRPDVVFASATDPENVLGDGQPLDPEEANLRLDWLRSDRSLTGRVFAPASYRELRQYQLDPHEINTRWVELNFVLEDREIGESYRPPEVSCAAPYQSPTEVAQVLRNELIPLELVLSLEYLYAYFSLRHPEELDKKDRCWPSLRQDLGLVRRHLLMIAVSEMTHYRWAHQLLWSLHAEGLVSDEFQPITAIAPKVPRPEETGNPQQGFRQTDLRPLTPDVLADLIAVEIPSGFIDGAYSRVVSTLRNDMYPKRLYELAVRIDTDGMSHYSRLREIAQILEKYGEKNLEDSYLRSLRLATPEEAAEALQSYEYIMQDVEKTFAAMAQEEFNLAAITLDRSREYMTILQEQGEKLARNGLGIPFFHRYQV